MISILGTSSTWYLKLFLRNAQITALEGKLCLFNPCDIYQ